MSIRTEYDQELTGICFDLAEEMAERAAGATPTPTPHPLAKLSDIELFQAYKAGLITEADIRQVRSDAETRSILARKATSTDNAVIANLKSQATAAPSAPAAAAVSPEQQAADERVWANTGGAVTPQMLQAARARGEGGGVGAGVTPAGGTAAAGPTPEQQQATALQAAVKRGDLVYYPPGHPRGGANGRLVTPYADRLQNIREAEGVTGVDEFGGLPGSEGRITAMRALPENMAFGVPREGQFAFDPDVWMTQRTEGMWNPQSREFERSANQQAMDAYREARAYQMANLQMNAPEPRASRGRSLIESPLALPAPESFQAGGTITAIPDDVRRVLPPQTLPIVERAFGAVGGVGLPPAIPQPPAIPPLIGIPPGIPPMPSPIIGIPPMPGFPAIPQLPTPGIPQPVSTPGRGFDLWGGASPGVDPWVGEAGRPEWAAAALARAVAREEAWTRANAPWRAQWAAEQPESETARAARENREWRAAYWEARQAREAEWQAAQEAQQEEYRAARAAREEAEGRIAQMLEQQMRSGQRLTRTGGTVAPPVNRDQYRNQLLRDAGVPGYAGGGQMTLTEPSHVIGDQTGTPYASLAEGGRPEALTITPLTSGGGQAPQPVGTQVPQMGPVDQRLLDMEMLRMWASNVMASLRRPSRVSKQALA